MPKHQTGLLEMKRNRYTEVRFLYEEHERFVHLRFEQILSALIENFPGTNKAFFEENGKVKKILEGKMQD